jgi:ketosteroid isomerase-like protein
MPEESTTPDLFEVWRQANNAFNERDLDAVMRFYARDAVLDAGRTLGIVERGREAIRGIYDDWFAAYGELKVALEEPFDLGNGVAFAVLHQEGRLLGARGYLQRREGVISVLAEGLVTNQVFYQDIDEARAAAERLAEERA